MSKRCNPCAPEKMCNPESGRCVLKTGAIGKKLLAAGHFDAPNTPKLVDASFRKHPTTGGLQPLPKSMNGRKAPAGHAKHFKNQVAVGLDGYLWISKPIKTGAYRWKPHRP